MFKLLAQTLRRYPRAFIWVATAIGITSVLMVFGASLADSRATVWRFSEQSLQNVTMLAAQDLMQRIESFDLSLQAVRDGAADPEVMALNPKLRDMVLFDRSTRATGLGSIIVLNADGRIVIGSDGARVQGVDLSDRDYFRAHRDAVADIGLHVSRPFRSRINGGEWRLGFSRRISRPDGSFMGVVLGGVRLSSITAVFNQIDLGFGGTISLMRDDGVFIAGNDAVAKVIGSDQSASELVHAFARQEPGIFVSAAAKDGVERIYASLHFTDLPLRIAVGRAVGTMEAAWRKKTLILTIILSLMSAAVVGLVKVLDLELRRRMRAEQRSASLARTDGLTGLANRRMFDEVLRREWTSAAQAGTSLALVICDIDWFKAFNDQYGHQAGDRALVGVAAVVAKSIRRSSDLAARYGGEEFVVLLPRTDLAAAAALAHTIRLNITALAIPHRQSGVGWVTVSCGVACVVPTQGIEPATLLEAADEALYRAKENGRHAVALHQVDAIPSAAAA